MELSGKAIAEAAADVRKIVGRIEPSRKGQIVATYPYTDEDGELLFQCLRYKPKAFSQRRPDGSGGWIGNLDGVRRVLFRLHTLKDTDTVLLAEGEKDVLNLVKLGFTATCNPMGAEKWRAEYSDQLVGKHVVIFPDNDVPGARHVKKAAQSLFGKAASVRIARISVGKDVSEWIEQGATREDIQNAIDASEDYRNSVPSEPAPSTLWHSALMVTERGSVRPILANAITALRLAPEWAGVLEFNDFSLGTVTRRLPPWQTGVIGHEWTDHEDRLAADWLQHQGILVSVDIAGQAVQAVARDRLAHPVREYLDKLRWDGTRRIETWLAEYLGVNFNEYSAAVGSRWLISAVARIYKPGVKADCCLILEGPQGAKKSTALRVLAGTWFTDEIAELGSKDAAMQTRGVWIIEIAELDSMSKAEVGKVKGFMSRATDRFRPPYGRRPIESPRQCVFAGSVNHTDYLRDETGGRRFWPVSCGQVKIDELERDRDQLWAEARERFLSGQPWWLDSQELNEHASDEQSDRCEEDPWHETIAVWIEDQTDVSITRILTSCIEKPRYQWTQQDKNRIARCLLRLGWVRYKSGARGAREWRYRRA